MAYPPMQHDLSRLNAARIRVFGALLTFSLLGLSLSGCGGGSQPTSVSSATDPTITMQPTSQSVTAGQTATFAVAATGTAPLRYQWQKNGTNIAGATASTYTTPSTTSSDNGSQFTVVVNNAAGSVTSNRATITVNSAASDTLTQNLLLYLISLKGNRILSGQHADYYANGAEMDQVSQITASTGQTPSILGVAFSLGNLTSNADPIALSNQWLAKGGIVLGMFSPGNPTYSAQIIGGPTEGPNEPNGHPIDFANLLVPGTVEYTRWYAGLDALVAELKAINGPVMMRPFPEFDRTVQWWASQPPAEFTAVWREMVTYIRGKGVNNVLWVFNLGGGVMDAMRSAQVPGYIDSYYPGSDYVDIVSMDCYPPSSANAPTIAALTALNKPVIYAEMGAVKGNPLPPPFTGDTGVAVATIISNFPQVVAAVVWGSTEALPEQNGMSGYVNNSKMINLDGLPRF